MTVVQPPIGDAAVGNDVTVPLSVEDLARAQSLMCNADLIRSLELRDTCTAPCSDVFVTVEGGVSDGMEWLDPFAGLCVCAMPEHPYSDLYGLLVLELLPKYFATLKHPPHL
jgi:hypothetical protein